MAETPKWMLWTGRILSALVAAMVLFAGVMKLFHPPQMLADWTGKFGYPVSTVVPIGILEMVCALVYLVPRTSVFGAILLGCYLGGATATHVRIGDPAGVAPVVFGIVAWLGLWMREPRLRALLPLRSSPR
jgi:DoxX-like family